MKGSTGTSQTVVRILSGTKTATDLRQKRLKQATASHFVNVHKLTGAAGAYRALKKMQRLNDLDRSTAHVQYWHTLVSKGTVPLRHQRVERGGGEEAEPLQPAEPAQPLLGDGEAEVVKVLVACEFSGVVRDAFARRGHEAWSCDLLPTESPGNHIQGDVLHHLSGGWDLMIAHPPCTHLSSSGARHFSAKRADGRQQQGIDFFMAFTRSGIARVCIENPIGIMSTVHRKPDQIIQPWQFGHTESKATCLWLTGLPKLIPTKVMTPEWKKNPDGTDWTCAKGKRESLAHARPQTRWSNQTASGQNKLGPSPDRWKLRSITYQGIAEAMAEQWG